MMRVHLDKIVTYSQDLKGGYTKMWDSRYKDLAKHLAGVKTITVDYPYGQRARRVKQLETAGYTLQETIWQPDGSALHHRVKQIWTRG